MSGSIDAGPQDAKRRGMHAPAAAVAGLAMVAIGCRPLMSALLAGSDGLEWIDRGSLYSRAVLVANYLQDGFVRRGLGGTIVALLSDDWRRSAVLFTIASMFWLAVPLALLLRQLGRRVGIAAMVFFAAVIALSPQTFLGWGWDLARTDTFAAGFVAWAAFAMVERRVGVAVACLLAGVLVHEVALIFGAPLVAVLTGRQVAAGGLDRRDGARAATALAIGFVTIAALQALFSPAPAVLAQHMLDAGPPATDPEMLRAKSIAAYMQTAGLRGVRSAVCFNLAGSPRYAIWAAIGLVVLGLYQPMLLLGRRWSAFLLVAVAPALLLTVLANDSGRWVQLGVLNAWLLAVVDRCHAPPEAPSARQMAAGAALLTVLLLLGSTRIDRVNRLPMMVTAALGVQPGPSFEAMIQRCDPQWQADLRPTPASEGGRR